MADTRVVRTGRIRDSIVLITVLAAVCNGSVTCKYGWNSRGCVRGLQKRTTGTIADIAKVGTGLYTAKYLLGPAVGAGAMGGFIQGLTGGNSRLPDTQSYAQYPVSNVPVSGYAQYPVSNVPVSGSYYPNQPMLSPGYPPYNPNPGYGIYSGPITGYPPQYNPNPGYRTRDHPNPENEFRSRQFPPLAYPSLGENILEKGVPVHLVEEPLRFRSPPYRQYFQLYERNGMSSDEFERNVYRPAVDLQFRNPPLYPYYIVSY